MKFTGTIASVNPKADDTSVVTNLLPKADITSSVTNHLPKPDDTSIIAPVSPIGDDTSIISSFGESDTKIQQTRVDVEGASQGTDTTAKQEIETLNFSSSGNSGVIVNTPATNQAYSYGYTGTGGTNEGSVTADGEELDVTFTQFEADGTTSRVSGVFTEAGDGKYALSIADFGFATGIAQTAQTLGLTGSASGTVVVGETYSWPSGSLTTTLPSGWSYVAGGGSSSTFSTAAGKLTNNTGSVISLKGATYTLEFDVTAIPDGTPLLVLDVSGSSGPTNAHRIIGNFPVGTYSRSITFSNDLLIADGDSIYLTLRDNGEDQGVSYDITSLSLSLVEKNRLSYSLDLDTADTVLTGTATGSASNGASLTTFLGEVSSAVTTQYSSVTAGSVVSSDLELTASGTGEDSRTTSSFLGNKHWDVRESTSHNSATVSYSSWGDWASNSLHIGNLVSTGWLSTSLGDLWSASIGQAGSTLVVTDSGDSGNTATFSVTPGYVTNITNRMQFSLDSLVSSSGTPPTSFSGTDGWIYGLTADVSHKSILFDTHQTTELVPSFSTTDNSGDVGNTQISNVFGEADQLSLTLAPEHASTPILTTLSSQGGYVQNAGELAESIIARQSSTNKAKGTFSFAANSSGATGSLTVATISGDPRLIPTDIIVTISDTSDRASQLTQAKTGFDAATTADCTGVISGNDLVLEADNARAYDEFSVTLSNIADPTAVNVRSDHVSDVLVSGNNTKEVFDLTFNDISLTAAEFDNLDQVAISNVFDIAVHSGGNGRFTIRPGGSNSEGIAQANDAGFAVQTPASLYDNTQNMVDHYNTIVGRLYTMSKVSDGNVKLTAINYGVMTDVSVADSGGANSAAFGATGSVTTSGAGDGIVSIDSIVTGDIVDSVYSTVGGTNSTSLSTLTHEVRGVDGSTRESSVLNITNASESHGHTNATYSATLANVITGSNIGAAIVTGFGVIGGFTMGTPTSTAVTAEDDMSGVANTVNVAIVPGTNEDGTTANIAVTNTTTTTGANTFNTGTHTALNINFNGESFPITYENDRTPTQQASDTSADINSNATSSSASASGNVVTLTADSAGVAVDGSVLVTAAGTPTTGTYTAPVQTITQQGTGGTTSFTSTIEGGGLTGNATYGAFSATKAQWITGMSTAVNSNTDTRVYETDSDGFAFASVAQDTFPNGTYTVSDETGDLTITMTTLYKGHN